MRRTFIAIKTKFDNSTIAQINNIKECLIGEKIRWVKTENIHVTLKFLSDTSDEKIGEIDNVLNNIAKNSVRFSFNLKGLGVFRNIKTPRVIWLGINNDEKLQEIYGKIETGLSKIGFRNSKTNFIPHITLGRMKFIKNPKATIDLINQNKNTIFQEINVTEIILFESILQQTGSIYKEIHKYYLL